MGKYVNIFILITSTKTQQCKNTRVMLQSFPTFVYNLNIFKSSIIKNILILGTGFTIWKYQMDRVYRLRFHVK